MFGFPTKVSWPNIASLPRNVSSSSQQIPSEVSDFPIAIEFFRHHASRPPHTPTPPLFTCLVTCHRYEFTAIVSWGDSCFYMTTESLLPLGHSLLISCDCDKSSKRPPDRNGTTDVVDFCLPKLNFCNFTWCFTCSMTTSTC